MTLQSTSYLLKGVDGSEWRNVGVTNCTLATPMRFGKTPLGLAGAAFKHQDSQWVDQDGVTWDNAVYGPNTVTLRDVKFGPIPPGQDALDRWLDFLDAFGGGRELGEFHAFSRRRNEIRDRFQYWRLASELPDPDHDVLINTGFVKCGDIKLRSDESWWRQDPVDVSFTSAQFAGATVRNDSDDPGWGYWEITGPITNPSIGPAFESITLLITVPAGQTWKIETDPNAFKVRDGANVDRSFLRVYWRKKIPVTDPKGPAVALGLGGTGTNGNTRIRLVVPQKFRRAV